MVPPQLHLAMSLAGNFSFHETKQCWLKRMANFVDIISTFFASIWKSWYRVGRDDPRRVVHAVKVGLALTLVSFLYIFEPLFKGVGKNAMWAVMTVVVVLEFTAGATLCKGLNRGFGTLCAGSLAFLIEVVAEKSGKTFRAVFVGLSVFIIGFVSTYLRFFPQIKKNFDYGVLVFLLTFNLISVSSFREENVVPLARDRLFTIAIGCGICLFMSIVIFPNWSGEDLHEYTVRKLEGLATSIEACVSLYFQDQEKEGSTLDVKSTKEMISKGYRIVLDSKSSDETLAMFASWEPRHSRHCYKYPWQQYVKLGTVLRHFGYSAVSLHGCLESEIQTPPSVRALFRDPCIRVATEISKVLLDLASCIRAHHRCSPDVLSDHLHQALHDLNSALRSQPRLFLNSKNNRSAFKHAVNSNWMVSLPSAKSDAAALVEKRNNNNNSNENRVRDQPVLRPTLSKIAMLSLEFSEALPFAAFAALLVEMAARLELIIEEVEELGRQASFKEFDEELVSIEVRRNETKENVKIRDLPSHAVPQAVD
ncbi:aluminum activated malate transporter family protein [Rhynchospora pubera]|uniref:Aluminum activated malate transporter family protein n=1 Tax=Rhynchospora pubera TaxID=906938 RepID=A0AAV8GHA6_9POAL|nr:aluminum activated malate transporter family protein [Rhynchospora pubera]KAJ4802796.1 aluminum activated malate transporter family protein [Rhynchospora pubera]